MRWQLPVEHIRVLRDHERDNVNIVVYVWLKNNVVEVSLRDSDGAIQFLNEWVEYCIGVRDQAPHLTLEVP